MMAGYPDNAVYLVDVNGKMEGWNEAGGQLRPSALSSGASMEAVYEPEEVTAGVPQRELETARREGSVSTIALVRIPDGREMLVKRVVSHLHGGPGLPPRFSISLAECGSEKETGERLRRQLKQQAAVAELGLKALANDDTDTLLSRACESVANALGVERTSVLETAPGPSNYLFRAGVGWPAETIGQAVPAPSGSLLALVEHSGAPVVVRENNGIPRPPFAQAEDLRSSASVPIHREGRPFGILTAYSPDYHRFTDEDVNFLQAVANLLAIALERRHVEASLRRQAEDLSRSNAELQQFAYVASHDLQEPLRTVASFVQMLEKHYHERLDDEGREYIAFAVDGIKRMSQLVRDLLTYSRAVSATGNVLRDADLNGVLSWSLANLKSAIEEAGAEIAREPLPTVAVDSMQLSQVFEQVIGNALKFRSEAPPRIKVSATEETDAWRISIEDNGLGIDPQYFDRIFGAFKRLHGRQYPGTGIGLAICRTIIERHAGRIWVESLPGQGSTFHFTLPK